MKKCRFCGRENELEDQFCRGCGAKLSEQDMDPAESESADKNQDKVNRKKFILPAIAAGVLVLSVAMGGTVAVLRGKEESTEGARGETENETVFQQETFVEPEEDIFDLSLAKLEDNYIQPEGMGVIDLGARNHQPAARDTSALWDKGLFYYLEDIGGEDDNHIADSLLDRMELTRKDNGKTMEYEVYRDKDTKQIQKIVSIEVMEDGSLELSDYYYQDGMPNFVFRRNDSIYTPSYATIDKTGERYYFSGDQMVKWRWIYEPSVVKQWILEPEDTWYTQWGYMEISDGERGQYDEKENQVLNEAYNTYDAILANEPVVLIQGCVTDEGGYPLEGVEVGIGRFEDGKAKTPKIKLATDKDGKYAWEIEDGQEEEEYFLVFKKEGWIPSLMMVSDRGTGGQMMQVIQDDMVLLKETGEDEVSITIYTCQIREQKENGTLARGLSEGTDEEKLPVLAGASVKVYLGVNCLFGNPVAEGETSENGMLSVALPAGVYTAVVEKAGIVTSRKVFFAGEEDEEQIVYAMTAGDDGTGEEGSDVWSILLTWKASDTEPLDLDSSLFTPEKASKGDRKCINTLNRDDNGGARLLYDGEGNNACELITLTAPKRGSYKYYVTDYTDIQAGGLDSGKMARSEAKVTVIHNGVPVRTFSVPDDAGVVWEVFELRNQGIVPIQEIYESLEGKNWWLEDKKLARLSERNNRANWIQSDGEWLYFRNPADKGNLYYCRKDGSELTKINDDRWADERFVLAGDYIYYIVQDDNSYDDYKIVRIKNDGTERMIIQDNIKTSGVALMPPVSLWGYADGMLYYHNDDPYFPGYSGNRWYDLGGTYAIPVDGGEVDASIWSLAEEDFNGDSPHYNYGNHAEKTVVVGQYLYYVGVNMVDTETYLSEYNFCRKNLKTGEEECLMSQIDWDTESWRIYKGWLYYTKEGIIRRTRIAGPGSFTEHQTLAENGVKSETVYNGDSLDGYYTLEFDGDCCYYQGNDNQMYVMNLDGSNRRVLPSYVYIGGPENPVEPSISGRIWPVDGELYRVSDGIMVSDRNGENEHELFYVSSFIKRSAGAYAEFMENYVPAAALKMQTLPQFYSESSFACQDINNDGICELFVSSGTGVVAGWHISEMDYYTYNGTEIIPIWNDSENRGSEVYINKDAQEIVIFLSDLPWGEGIDRYRFDGSLIETYGVSGRVVDQDDDTKLTAEEVELLEDRKRFETAYAIYAEPYPRLRFIENTPRNREIYLRGGRETGWESQ